MRTQNKGYVSVYRTLMEHWLWTDKPFTQGQAWIDMIMLANHDDVEFVYEGRLIHGKRGYVYRSIAELSERWGWGREKTAKFLETLHREKMIILKKHKGSRTTNIYIRNYDMYQSGANRHIDRSSTGSRQLIDIYNNNIGQADDKPARMGESNDDVIKAKKWFENLKNIKEGDDANV